MWSPTILAEVLDIAGKSLAAKENTSIAYHGNVVDLLEYLAAQEFPVDLLSDQTSCHVVYDGGYCPQGIDFAERTRLLATDRTTFRALVDKSLRRHYEAIQKLSQQGAYFFDYGNAFLKAVFDAGVTEVVKNGVDAKDGFVFPSYFEDIMGPIFDYGYGPFRWVCLSGKAEDLDKTDQAAMSCIDPSTKVGGSRQLYLDQRGQSQPAGGRQPGTYSLLRCGRTHGHCPEI